MDKMDSIFGASTVMDSMASTSYNIKSHHSQNLFTYFLFKVKTARHRKLQPAIHSRTRLANRNFAAVDQLPSQRLGFA